MGTEHKSAAASAASASPASTAAPASQSRIRPWACADIARRLLSRAGALAAALTERPVSLYAAAVLRIGYGLLYLAFLVREFPHRDEIWGPGSAWTPELAEELFDQTDWVSVLTLSDSRAYFEVCYAVAVVTCVLFTLGWRTRAVSVLFAAVVASFHARAIFMTDGGDNLILLMAVYLVLTACGRRWSLDARRARLRTSEGGAPKWRAGPAGVAGQVGPAGPVGPVGPVGPASPVRNGFGAQLRDTRTTLVTVLHNCGMFVIAAQVCVLYGSAGLYKVQGSSWGNGTALHYVLNLDLFRPWPALSLMADGHTTLITVVGYLTVLLQVAFPFVLFGRLKYPVLALLLGMHIGIAVFMGLPLFSGAMIIADAVFLPDRFYRFLGRLWRRTPPQDEAVVARPPRDGTVTVPSQPGPVAVQSVR
ncbi:HTTM domain-containing protein [Streptomyces sp. NPDC050804]|uniref:HTTM domain-containing protein n=1 Tax=Streptomyces sp. NPDC050804 TaxID=3154745 RepID=UPI00341AD28A